MPDRSIPLVESGADPDPFVQFGRWFDEAAAVVQVPEAMAVATAGADGRPSVRMVLLKRWDRRGFVFHTNYEGRKGSDLHQNPVAALLFHWDPLGRQVRVEGPTERVSAAESDEYFATRPFAARIGALASRQSRPVADRDVLDARVRELTAAFEGREVPRPAWWGGFRVRPGTFEFWQNREDRLHDRIRYVPSGTGGGWRRERLQP